MIDINKKTLKTIISICVLTIFNIGCVSLEPQSIDSKTQDKRITSETVFLEEKDSINQLLKQVPESLEIKIVGYVNKDVLQMFSSPTRSVEINHVTRGTKVLIFDTSGNLANISADIEHPYWVDLAGICFTENCWKQKNTPTVKSSVNIRKTSPSLTKPPKSSTLNKKISSNQGRGYTNVDGKYVPSPRKANKQPSNATARCRDGTWSFSLNRRGTCSGHGGVANWL
ncbi:DUF3761 domain-containing protein [Fusobacterium pseudoperiodonticum]|uniref:DUF3761 domain-containing protein n=1 Tax=Fusobacterium pseudoperiodonticum TaxID=2663009 RepID=UPI0028D6C1C5|nr:DUF3761 domain-containing protein [Fusobacterium pseudoperiodonticum]